MKSHTFLIHYLWLASFFLFPRSVFATIADVYVYNTEFRINMPGRPVVGATISAGDTIRWVWLQGGHTTTSVAGRP